jgi:ABC-type cobalamin transport system permease subunit
MNMGFNFNTRTGSVGISNFDGMNVGAAVAETSTSTQALFSGGLTGSGMTGVVNGAFVNNGALKADGVIGVFSFGNGAAVRAEGTIAGRRTQ